MVKNKHFYPKQLNEALDRKQEKRDASWLAEKLNYYPKSWAEKLRKKHYEIKAYSYKKSNLYILDAIEYLESQGLKIGVNCHDSDLIDMSRDRAKMVEDFLNNELLALSQSGADLNLIFNKHNDEWLIMVCEDWLITPPKGDIKAKMNRLIDYRWWLRKLRVMHAQIVEALAIHAGMVSRENWLYVSEDTLIRRSEQLRRGLELMKGVKLKSDEGDLITLEDAYKAGVANPKNRVNELITRMKGFESLARESGHFCVFVTITCPSRMHSVGGNNEIYDGTKPNEAQAYLTKQWSLVRAKLARDGVDFYGLRVVEPHHDGTPHWHMALFYKKQIDFFEIRRAVLNYFLFSEVCEGWEVGASENRVKFLRCDARGAVGYMLKYIVKNMRSFGIDGELSDEADANSFDVVDRVEAWASTWRIRQFQFLGGHAITTWRELRRVAEKTVKEKSQRLKLLWAACQRVGDRMADFASYIREQGGLNVSPKKSAYVVAYELIENSGRYGDAVVKKVLGIASRYSKEFAVSCRKEWVRI